MKPDFVHRFEGAEVLDGLLDLAGSPLDSHGVLARFVEGLSRGAPSSAVIPTLFEGEPRFGDPALARRLFQNLLGLWDLAASGKKVVLDPQARPKRVKKERPTPPPPWGEAGPDGAFVEAAWRYLEDLPEGDPKELERLTHAFENRQDALLQWLDEAGLADDAYGTARYLLFELFVMISLGSGQPPSAVDPGALGDKAAEEAAPRPLVRYAEEALEESELEGGAAARVVMTGLAALWRAGK